MRARQPRRVVFEASFEAAVVKFGGYQRLDPVLFPIVDSLYANPFGFPVLEDDWIPLCRFAVTKPMHDIPSFVVIFTIDSEQGVISLRDIFENEDY